MVFFHNDYSEGCHPKILELMTQTNMEQADSYGNDIYCAKAAQYIRDLCNSQLLDVFFLSGGTQTNLTVISGILRPYQGVVCADTGHINVHETGAIEATGHKVLPIPTEDGKISAKQIQELIAEHFEQDGPEHMVQPGMVYISNPTELGTIYTRDELKDISEVCKANDIYLYLDGARLGYALQAAGNDVSMEDIADFCDVFYIGGTKVGALLGEAVVFSDNKLSRDFRYLIKQRGGMLAKGRLLGIQFCGLLEDGLYFTLAKHANLLADRIRAALDELGYSLYVPGSTNQIFAILPDSLLDSLSGEFTFSVQHRYDSKSSVVRFCTSWATVPQNVELLCEALKKYS